MVKNIVLFDKIRNIASEWDKKDISIRYLKYLNEKTGGFSKTKIKIKKLREFDKRFEITISGPEEIFVLNLLKKEVGSIHDFEEVRVGRVYKGTMVDVGKVGFGIFVDCAILNPKVDVLLPLHGLRKQLCHDKEKSLKEIVRAYEFIDNFPLYVKILKVNAEDHKIQGEIDVKTLKMFNKIVNENIEGIIVNGSTKNQLKKALISKGHLRDIISIERYSFFEHIVLFKQNTDAPGIIAHVGKDLKKCKISAIRSYRIKKIFE